MNNKIMKRYVIVIIIVGLVLLVQGCSGNTMSQQLSPMVSTRTEVPHTYTSTTKSVPSLTPVITHTKEFIETTPHQSTNIIQTNTPMLGKTAEKHILIASTSTIIPTLTPESTLPAKEREALILELLQTNEGCEFPCFWGIVPGETNWGSADRFLSRFVHGVMELSPQDNSTPYGIGIYIVPEPKSAIKIDAQFYVVEGTVNHILGVIAVDDFKRYMKSYTFEYILENYGIPSRVWINRSWGENNPIYVGYQIWLVYEAAGFMIGYEGAAINTGNSYRICPDQPHQEYLDIGGTRFTEKFGRIHFYAQSVDNTKPIDEFIQTSGAQPLEKVSNITISELYEGVLKDGTYYCLDSITNFHP